MLNYLRARTGVLILFLSIVAVIRVLAKALHGLPQPAVPSRELSIRELRVRFFFPGLSFPWFLLRP